MPSDRGTLAACRWELQNQVQHHIYQALLHEMPLFKDIVPARHDPSSGAAHAPLLLEPPLLSVSIPIALALSKRRFDGTASTLVVVAV